MAQPYVGEIRMFGGNFNPAGWEFCNGQLVPISENETLFNLIGTTYGGDGESTFALPNLQGRVPIHQGTAPSGNTYQMGEAAGVESVTLTTNQIPSHNHAVLASNSVSNNASPAANLIATPATARIYASVAPTSQMAPNAVTPEGGSQPHENMQPFLCVSFIISMFGLYPQPS